MKSYKVEFTQTTTFVFDVQAENEEQARTDAEYEMTQSIRNGMTHHHITGESDAEISTVYDVTGTDDDAFMWTCGKCETHFPNTPEQPRCPNCKTLVD